MIEIIIIIYFYVMGSWDLFTFKVTTYPFFTVTDKKCLLDN